MIAIKGIFGDWLEVDIPKAKEYVKKNKAWHHKHERGREK